MAGYYQMTEGRNRALFQTHQKCSQQRYTCQEYSKCFLNSAELSNKRDVRTVQRNMETERETKGEDLCFTASLKRGHGF